MTHQANQRPIIGSIHHDNSGSSRVVLNIVGDKVLLEYASGTVASVDVENWQQLQPQIAVYKADSTTRGDQQWTREGKQRTGA